MHRLVRTWLGLVSAMSAIAVSAEPQEKEVQGPLVPVGLAREDITPEVPIRLCGYPGRTAEATSVGNHLWARAMAIGADPASGGDPSQQPVVMITVELIGITSAISDAVADELWHTHGIDRAHVAVCATHVHTGPMLEHLLSNMYGKPLPADQLERVRRYSETLTARLKAVAEAALADRRPSRLGWGQGTVAFATARRKIEDGKWAGFTLDLNGIADRTFPLLRVTGADGGLRGVFVSYACHNTTLLTADNYIDPDWGGDAARRIEAEHGGSTALVGLGCAGDADPAPRGKPGCVAMHGLEVATEVDRLLAMPLAPLGPVTAAGYRRIELPFDHPVTRETLAAVAADRGKAAQLTALQWAERIDAGEPAPTGVPFAVQCWTFGPRLAMVFLTGEVVSDYSLRLRRELGVERTWVNAYSNDLPCYVASSRMFPEGGYEVDSSMAYYGWPTRLAPRVEDLIVSEVHNTLPAGWEQNRIPP
jgi:neutral ceramidase